MGINKTYAVFGLGRYGKAVATYLANSGAQVLAVDINELRVEDMVGSVPVCKCADVTDPEVINQLGISDFDTVIISMASRFEASVMTTMLCKEAGVKEIIVKCSNFTHKKILEKVGADTVVLPEHDSGIRLAKNLLSAGFADLVELSDDISVVEIDVKDEWEGKNLIELDLRKKYSLNVIAVRENNTVSIVVDPSQPLSKDMKLVVVAKTQELLRLK